MSKVISLSTRIDKIPGIGPATSEKLTLLGLESAQDLLYLFPRNWEDLTHLSQISDLIPMAASRDSRQADGQKFTIKATISTIKTFRASARRMTITQAVATDDSGSITLVWFNQPYLAKSLQPDETYFISGPVTEGRRGLNVSNPTIELASHTPVHSGRIIPTYSSIGGLSTKILRRIFTKLIPSLEPVPEPLPPDVLRDNSLLSLDQSIRQLHFPTSSQQLEEAKHRLAFDELLAVQLQVQSNKLVIGSYKAKPIPTDIDFVKKIIQQLPYELTNGQKRALWDTLQDISKDQPTNRMIEGDVGSGKTIVATIAMLNSAKYGYQSVLMVPTEVLAVQHYHNLQPLVTQLGYTISLQTQSQVIGETPADIIIGTHKLIQKDISIPRLNLVIVDEQHRFGVRQREALKKIGAIHDEVFPHFISLTATPIPRSLALALFGDLNLSIIPTRPINRLPIITQVATAKARPQIYRLITDQLAIGHQAFVVTPLINTNTKLNTKSVETEAQSLREIFPQHSIAVLHGKLSSAEKNKTMDDFKSGRIDILVATTVIEVGIDIPNATVMFIEGAERFGLAQLHQLRGRVGRSQHQSYCFVAPTQDEPDIVEKLELFAQTTDGFALAQLDLEQRGAGSLLGTAQAGFIKFRLADWTDTAKIETAQTTAKHLLTQSPDLSAYPLLAQKINIINTPIHSE